MPQGKHNQACVELIDHLAKRGIVASVGHSKRSSRSPTTLTAYCQKLEDVPDVPLGFLGYRVYASTQAEADRQLRAARQQQPD